MIDRCASIIVEIFCKYFEIVAKYHMLKFEKYVKQRLYEVEDAEVANPADNVTPDQNPSTVMAGYSKQLKDLMAEIGRDINSVMKSAQKMLANSPDYEAKTISDLPGYKPANHPDFQIPTRQPVANRPSAIDRVNAYKQRTTPSLDDI